MPYGAQPSKQSKQTPFQTQINQQKITKGAQQHLYVYQSSIHGY